MSSQASRVLLTAASAVVVIAGMKAASALLAPFIVALFLTALSLPLYAWLARRLPSWVAVTLTALVNLAVVIGLGALVTGSVSSFVEAVPRYRERLEALFSSTLAWLDTRGLPASEWVSFENVGFDNFVDVVVRTLRGVASVLTNLLLVALTMIFILLEVNRLPAKLQVALGVSAEAYERYIAAAHQVQRYLVVKTLVSALTGLAVGLGMWVIGLDFPLLWGLTAFLLNYIPTLGSIIAAVPAVLLGLVTLSPAETVAIALVYLAVNISLGNLLEPQLLGRRLGLSPLVIFVSLVFWGWVWGPVGMLLSVPLTVIARIFFENSPELRWVAVLLAARPPLHPPPEAAPESPAEG